MTLELTNLARERFARGLTYDEFKARMTRNRERFEENERRAPLADEDLAAFRGLSAPLHVLVLAEDWCGDVVANLPLLGRIAKDAGTLDLRVFLRDQNEDLMNLYLNQGKFKSIPVFAFFDENFQEVGRFIERPASVTDLRAKKRAEVYASRAEFGSPDAPADGLPEGVRAELGEALQRMRDETKEFADREVVRELRAIVATAA